MFSAYPFAALRTLSPDGAVMVASLGLLLIFVELNRPGRVLPASLGLLLMLLASATLLRFGVQLWPALLAGAAVAVALGNLYRRMPLWLFVLATCGLVTALRLLVRPRGSLFVHTSVAVACGATLGIVSAVLTRIAYRARRAKALN